MCITADLHYSGDTDDPVLRGFGSLCRKVREEGVSLYLIGDLFDYWVGPRQLKLKGFQAMLDLLGRTASEVPVHVVPGNRDFAMGMEIGGISGLTLHQNDIEVTWSGSRGLLTHGDLLLQNDRAYQRMRRVLRTPLVRSTLRSLPLAVSLRLARALRSRSHEAVARKPSSAFEISFPKVRNLFRNGDYDVIVSGHVHRPAVHEGDLGGRTRTFFTLGAWGARGWIVTQVDGQVCMERYPGGGDSPLKQPLL